METASRPSEAVTNAKSRLLSKYVQFEVSDSKQNKKKNEQERVNEKRRGQRKNQSKKSRQYITYIIWIFWPDTHWHRIFPNMNVHKPCFHKPFLEETTLAW